MSELLGENIDSIMMLLMLAMGFWVIYKIGGWIDDKIDYLATGGLNKENIIRAVLYGLLFGGIALVFWL